MSFHDRYGFFDRLLHRFAFATTGAQRGVADLEHRLFRRELAAVTPGDPVFVTALPRAGTTALLQLLADCPPFATHTYRDMPFVLCPLLWSNMARLFPRVDAPQERAHGDGIQVSLDSPEAFEEVVWKAFWPACYRGPVIEPWARCDDAEFVEFFTRHMHEIVALRRRAKATATRYLSKNNANVARIPALWAALPRAIVLVPFREPQQHAASLLRQHERFTALHAQDPFARRYMAAIGHHDFGAGLKPIHFAQWTAGRGARDAGHLHFWLDYWIATYQHVLAHAGRGRMHLIRFESLGAGVDPAPLAAILELGADELRRRTTTLRPARGHTVDGGCDPARVAVANELYRELCARAVW